MVGSHCQFNVSVNEDICNRCYRLAGIAPGSKTPDANNHANKSRPLNHKNPSAMRIAPAVHALWQLLPGVLAVHEIELAMPFAQSFPRCHPLSAWTNYGTRPGEAGTVVLRVLCGRQERKRSTDADRIQTGDGTSSLGVPAAGDINQMPGEFVDLESRIAGRALAQS